MIGELSRQSCASEGFFQERNVTPVPPLLLFDRSDVTEEIDAVG